MTWLRIASIVAGFVSFAGGLSALIAALLVLGRVNRRAEGLRFVNALSTRTLEHHHHRLVELERRAFTPDKLVRLYDMEQTQPIPLPVRPPDHRRRHGRPEAPE